MTPRLTPDERARLLDSIRKHSDYLTQLSRQYDRLRWMAEKDPSDAFLNLADTAGKLTTANLQQLGALLDILFSAQLKLESPNAH